MGNVFLVYMPLRNAEAMAHYEDTIRKKVRLTRIAPFISPELRVRLQEVFGSHDVAVWGSVAGQMNRRRFHQANRQDRCKDRQRGSFPGALAANRPGSGPTVGAYLFCCQPS
jgi:hypothetical protein